MTRYAIDPFLPDAGLTATGRYRQVNPVEATDCYVQFEHPRAARRSPVT